MSISTIKEQARCLVERLPEDATWEDLRYQISVLQAIAAGDEDAREGRTIPDAEVRRRFGLDSTATLQSFDCEFVDLPPGMLADPRPPGREREMF